jgi:L-lactate dehydrogenase complex protein LldE
VKYPEISNRIAGSKVADVLSTGADYLVAGELGCLLQIEGKLHRDGHPVRAVHLAEVLAGTVDDATDESASDRSRVARRSEAVNGND